MAGNLSAGFILKEKEYHEPKHDHASKKWLTKQNVEIMMK